MVQKYPLYIVSSNFTFPSPFTLNLKEDLVNSKQTEHSTNKFVNTCKIGFFENNLLELRSSTSNLLSPIDEQNKYAMIEGKD